jgi:outer membrane biosynthesis protein TonB
VRSWRFTPARQAGHNIPASVEVPVHFNFSA